MAYQKLVNKVTSQTLAESDNDECMMSVPSTRPNGFSDRQHILDPIFGSSYTVLVESFHFLSSLGPIFKILYFLSCNCFICLLHGL